MRRVGTSHIGTRSTVGQEGHEAIAPVPGDGPTLAASHHQQQRPGDEPGEACTDGALGDEPASGPKSFDAVAGGGEGGGEGGGGRAVIRCCTS